LGSAAPRRPQLGGETGVVVNVRYNGGLGENVKRRKKGTGTSRGANGYVPYWKDEENGGDSGEES